MLTKTLRFDEDVLIELRAMTWSDDGRLGVIAGTLDRKLYERVNKALTAMGGAWNRKAGGHIFDSDPRPLVEGLLETGSLTVARDGFFETPPAVIRRMLELAPLPNYSTIVLEPSAGKGAILRALLTLPQAKWSMFHACEKDAQRRQYLVENFPGVDMVEEDFLEYHLPRHSEDGTPIFTYQRIYMNPPFEEGQDVTHVRHAYDLLQPDRYNDPAVLVSVMGEHAFFAGDRQSAEFRLWLEMVGGESEPLPANSFRESGTSVNARLVVIRR